jgi:hypothetical protein
MEIDTRTETACWCTSASGLLKALVPYAIGSYNASIAESRKLFADKLITDVGYALQPAHAGEIVTEQERIAARRIAAGLKMDDVNGLVDELGAIACARAILALRELIQRLRR